MKKKRVQRPWRCVWCRKEFPAGKGALARMLAHQHDCDKAPIVTPLSRVESGGASPPPSPGAGG